MKENKVQPKFGKKLTLNRETIRELTDSEAKLAAGGGVTVAHCGTNTCYTSCLGTNCTQGCASIREGATCTVSFIGPVQD